MQLSSPDATDHAHAWFADQLRYLSSGARVSESEGTFTAHLNPDQRARVCLLCCWHEPWAERVHGVHSAVSLSALYVMEVLKAAARHHSPEVSALFVAQDTLSSRAEAFSAGRCMLDSGRATRLVVVAAGCAPAGGLATAGGTSVHGLLDAAQLPPLSRSGLDDDVVDELSECHAQGIAACVLDPVLAPGRLLEPQDLWSALENSLLSSE
ncbi:hypothetical protein [Streptomyces sp. NPDC048637]|uniref:hypothetical protein n=1 Tax=Streptomyces sp. NPDC048637 TaxID=3155636 RepID=UPI00343B31BC